MALIPEDRKNEGLMLPMTVRENLSFAAIDGYSRFGVVDREAEEAAIGEMVRLLQIRSDASTGRSRSCPAEISRRSSSASG